MRSAHLKMRVGICVLCLVIVPLFAACSSVADDSILNQVEPQPEVQIVQEPVLEPDPQETYQDALSTGMALAEADVADLVAPYENKVAVAVVSLSDESLGFSINGDTQFVSASMIKLLILTEYMDEVDGGFMSPDSTYTKNSADVVGGTGRIVYEAAGSTYTYDDLVRYMIMYSDNTATNVLIDAMGFDAINTKAAELGLVATDLERKMMDSSSGKENHTSANDIATLLVGIASHTVASEDMCIKAEEYLCLQTDNDGLAKGLPAELTFGHKTGSLNSVRHDGGIVYGDNPYVIVVLCDIGFESANTLMSQISDIVYTDLGL